MIEFLNPNPAFWVILCFVWVGIGLVIEEIIVNKYSSELLVWTPKVLYDDMELNWFGSWFCYILLAIVNPCGLLLKLCMGIAVIVTYICHFIKWLFTVGRKNN